MKINIHASILSSRLSADINARLLQPCAHILNRRKVELSRSLNVSVDISRTIAVLSHQFGKTASISLIFYGVCVFLSVLHMIYSTKKATSTTVFVHIPQRFVFESQLDPNSFAKAKYMD